METKSSNSFKNYIILLIIFIVFIVLVLYFCELYKVNEEEKMKTPIIEGMLSEIYSEDLDHYVLDNPTTIIYLCAANDDECRIFERNFRKLLKKKNYQNQLVYLNLTSEDQEKFVNKFNDKYYYRIKLTTDYPAFILFENGKVKKILQSNDKSELNINTVKQFLELNSIED